MPSDMEPLGGGLPTATAFLFEVDGVEIGMFREVRGLRVDISVEEIPEGGQNGFVRKVPGRMSWPNVVLRRGLTQSDALFSWLSKTSGAGFAAKGNKLARTSGAVTALDSTGRRLRSWELTDVFPVRWIGPDFQTGRNEPLEEELEIAHHGFKSDTKDSS
ncbi:MAG TPA: phage tail protein [Jatrophihabitans sp.]|nr:phage tail protein [Jatrophihabitans sp.]